MRAGRLWSLLLLLAAAGCNTGLPIQVPGLPMTRQSDEEQIAAILEDVRVGMETQRIFKVVSHVSRSYMDEEGRNYDAIVEYLNEIFNRYRRIEVKRVPPKILVQGDTAQVVETFGTIAEPVDGVQDPPINIQGQVTVYLQRISGEWLITAWDRAA